MSSTLELILAVFVPIVASIVCRILLVYLKSQEARLESTWKGIMIREAEEVVMAVAQTVTEAPKRENGGSLPTEVASVAKETAVKLLKAKLQGLPAKVLSDENVGTAIEAAVGRVLPHKNPTPATPEPLVMTGKDLL